MSELITVTLKNCPLKGEAILDLNYTEGTCIGSIKAYKDVAYVEPIIYTWRYFNFDGENYLDHIITSSITGDTFDISEIKVDGDYVILV